MDINDPIWEIAFMVGIGACVMIIPMIIMYVLQRKAKGKDPE